MMVPTTGVLPRAAAKRPAPWPARFIGMGGLAFLAAHVPLALAMRSQAKISTLHVLLTLGIGLLWAISGRRPERVAYVGAYIVGAEVLWRMTNADVYWEFGKYASALIFLVYLFRTGRIKPPPAILLYFALLLPSAALTLANLDLSDARNEISFNLSGPFALMVSVWFFSYVQLSRNQLARVFMMLVAPVIGVGSIALYSTATASALVFGHGSNMTTSGGFGPNQVSAILSLGALLALLLVLNSSAALGFRSAMFGVVIALAAQSALTFSRTGLVLVGVCGFLASLYLVKKPRGRLTVVLVWVLLLSIAVFVLLPRLEALTGGAFGERFGAPSVTGRDQLARADLQIWQAHPILGVGPGQARALREALVHRAKAHTEFSRMLAEHGVLGLLSLGLLVGTAVSRFRAARGSETKALVVAVLSWSLLFMLVSAMRLVAPAFFFGLGSATLLTEKRLKKRSPRPERPTAELAKANEPAVSPFAVPSRRVYR
jgi:O-antigen ligase